MEPAVVKSNQNRHFCEGQDYPFIMKKMLFGLVAVALLSCEKTIYSPDPAEDTHELINITYTQGDGDGVETFVHPLHSLTYTNHTGVAKKVVVDPLTDVMESSQFFSNDERAFQLVDPAATHVAVPTQFNDGVATLGEPKWSYSSEVVTLPPVVSFRDTLEVPAYTSLTVTMSVYLNEYNLSYTAIFEGKPSGTLTEINGKWKGITVANVDKQIAYDKP